MNIAPMSVSIRVAWEKLDGIELFSGVVARGSTVGGVKFAGSEPSSSV